MYLSFPMCVCVCVSVCVCVCVCVCVSFSACAPETKAKQAPVSEHLPPLRGVQQTLCARHHKLRKQEVHGSPRAVLEEVRRKGRGVGPGGRGRGMGVCVSEMPAAPYHRVVDANYGCSQ